MNTINAGLILVTMTMLIGCSQEHRLESQLLRLNSPNSPLSVVVWTDSKGEISTSAGVKPRVAVQLGTKEVLAVEVVGDATTLYIQGKRWSEIPKERKNIEVRFHGDSISVRADGVDLKCD